MAVGTNAKKVSYIIATAGLLGEKLFGGILASLLAIPLVLALATLSLLGANLFYWLLSVAAVLVLIVTQWALLYDPERAPKSIAIDKIIGLLIALIGVPFTLKVILFGVIFFHLVNQFHVFRFYRIVTAWLEKLPGVLGILIPDIVSGILVNGVIHVIIWVAR